jgi:hypothetical protein
VGVLDSLPKVDSLQRPKDKARKTLLAVGVLDSLDGFQDEAGDRNHPQDNVAIP